MRIPEEIVDRIRNALDIEEVVGEVVTLKRRGSHLFGLCPFHSEKSPSFSVHPGRGRYHCFGCGADGDAIEFVRETRGLDFMEAIEQLAQRVGVTLPNTEELSAQEKARLAQLGAMRGLLQQAQDIYCQQLQQRLKEPNDPVSRYCAGRGITAESAQRFGLGWAATGSTLALLGGREALGAAAGLLVTAQERGAYRGAWRERLRDRLTFPITDEQGRVIAFGGRIIAAENDAPKYLNTPETDLYKKSEALYRIHDARQPIIRNKRVIVVEGYMDAISLAQAGVQEVVACCGTALTDQHLKKLLKWADEVVMLFDGDEAGAKAGARTLKICLSLFQSGKHFRFASIPDGMDPDDWVRKHGVDSLRQVIDRSPALSEYLLEETARRHRGLRSVEDKAAFLEAVKKQIREAAIPESNFTSLLFKQAYAMAYRSQKTSQWSPGAKPQRPVASRYGDAKSTSQPAFQSLWLLLHQAVGKAPATASQMAATICPLLDPNCEEEKRVIDAFKDSQSRAASSQDDTLSADFLRSSVKLIIKKRRDDALEMLSKMKDRGEIDEAQYWAAALKVLGGAGNEVAVQPH